MSESLDPEIPVDGKSCSTVSKCGTVFGRVLMVLLLGVLAIEAHAKFGYDHTLTTLRATASKIEGENIAGVRPELEEWSLPLSDAEKCVKGFPSKSRRLQFQTPIVVLKWLSLFKTYVIQLQLDDENNVISLSTDDGDLD